MNAISRPLRGTFCGIYPTCGIDPTIEATATESTPSNGASDPPSTTKVEWYCKWVGT